MTKRYFRVKPEYDGFRFRYITGTNERPILNVYVVIANELLTPYMVTAHHFPQEWFDVVHVNVDNVYMFFGVRLEHSSGK